MWDQHFLYLKVWGAYYTQELNMNFLYGYVNYRIQDAKIYLWKKLTNELKKTKHSRFIPLLRNMY